MDINGNLRDPTNHEKLQEIQPYVDTLNLGLSRLPNYIGVVSRGVHLPDIVLRQHAPGALVEYKAFTSTTCDPAGYPATHKLVIQSYTGKHIDDFSTCKGEREVLFRSGTKFRVLKVEDGNQSAHKGSAKVIYLEEAVD